MSIISLHYPITILDIFVPVYMNPPDQYKYLLLFPPGGIQHIENKYFSTVWLNSAYKRKSIRLND